LFDALADVGRISGISPRMKSTVKQFRELIQQFSTLSQKMSVTELVKQVLNRSGYLAMLEHEDTPEADSRIGNLKELVSAVAEYEEQNEHPSIAGFLEQVSLIAGIDGMDPDSSYVTLMTLHLAKGLEFSHVFVTGMEEGLFPIGDVVFDTAELEEERRLAYVGMTRAKNKLYLTHASSRKLFGQKRWNIPSRFISEAGFATGRIEQAHISEGGYYDGMQEDGYKEGSRIRHPEFGEGKITQRTGSGESLKITVQFKSGIWKKLLVKYASIEKM